MGGQIPKAIQSSSYAILVFLVNPPTVLVTLNLRLSLGDLELYKRLYANVGDFSIAIKALAALE